MKKTILAAIVTVLLLAGCDNAVLKVDVKLGATTTPTAMPPPTETPLRSVTSAPPSSTVAATRTPTPFATATPVPTATPAPTVTPTPAPARPPTRIVIPSIGLDAPVEPVGVVRAPSSEFWTYDVPAHRAAGWHQDTATLGMPGNTVLNGHNNIHGYVFVNMVDVKKGDVITLYSKDIPFKYVIVDVLFLLEAGQPDSVRISNASYIMPTSDERLTIVSCWPRNNNTHRLIVIARPA